MASVELTDRFCATAKPVEGKQTDYFDTIVRGLCLRVSPAGTRAWNLHYTRPSDGRRVRLKLGTYPELKLGPAREKARKARGSIGDGGDPAAEKKAKAPSQSVSDLVENYLERHAKTKRSADEIGRRLRKNVGDVIGTIKLADLHRRDLTKCIDAVMDRGARVEANRVFEDIRAMVRWARGRGDLDSNLAEGMRRPSEPTVRDRVLTADEIKAVWRGLPDADMRESTARVVRLCLITGQRVGEVAGMTRDELDLKRGTWTIPPERSKNGREHVVPLSPMAVEVIQAQLMDSRALAERKRRRPPPYVFPAPGGRAAVGPTAIAKAVKRQEAPGKGGRPTILGAAPWTCHDLRRTAATFMEELGVSPFVVGHVLNHVSVTRSTVTSRVYARYSYDREKREALELWAVRLTGILDDKANVEPMRGEPGSRHAAGGR